jgi:hypothetical protein
MQNEKGKMQIEEGGSGSRRGDRCRFQGAEGFFFVLKFSHFILPFSF